MEWQMEDQLIQAARWMAVAARTAPKGRGEDDLTVQILDREETHQLGDAMVREGEERDHPGYIRDGGNLRNSGAVLLLGLRDARPLRLDCGACGHPRCADLPASREGADFAGPICAIRLMDLGIALGSAAKTASLLNVDNRIMYRIGAVARRIGLIRDQLCMGIPLAATGKNLFFDRPIDTPPPPPL